MKEKTANEIKIKLKDIAKLQHFYIEIFTEEDEDYPDARAISNKERAAQRILDKITDIQKPLSTLKCVIKNIYLGGKN